MFGLLRCCLLPPWPWFWLKFFQVMLVLYQIRVLLLSGTLAEKSPLSKLSNETMFQVPFFTIPALNGTSSAGEPHLWSKISLGFVVSIFRTWVGLMFGACNMATTHGWKKSSMATPLHQISSSASWRGGHRRICQEQWPVDTCIWGCQELQEC